MRIISTSKEQTWEIAKDILNDLQGMNIIALEGELGAGKTTFSQGLLHAAGAEGPFTSPTFVIMKKYDLKGHEKFDTIYHLDCYRVGSQDVLELGWDELINNPRNLVLVEWPERIREILPTHYLELRFLMVDEHTREISRSFL